MGRHTIEGIRRALQERKKVNSLQKWLGRILL